MPSKLSVCSQFSLSRIILFETVRSDALVKLAISTELAMAVAIEAARASGEILLKYFREDAYRTRYKEDTSLQTTADLELEQAIINTIKSNFPEHSIDSEEHGYFCTLSSYTWIIDALDGTENFVLGIPYFSSSITLCKENVPQIAVVYNPVTEDLYTAERGYGAFLNGTRIGVSNKVQLKGSRAFFIPDFDTKRFPKTTCLRNKLYGNCRRVLDTWSPALDWCLVASGKVNSVVSISHRPIKPDAGILILEEAGGKITDFQNRAFNDDNNGHIVGSNALLHDQLLQLINEE